MKVCVCKHFCRGRSAVGTRVQVSARPKGRWAVGARGRGAALPWGREALGLRGRVALGPRAMGRGKV